ncbi:glycoside hydrolase family 127 protein [Bacteroides salyersiae]|uniref:glycoside hydrolase family 127 protein n=1 Tax=Bacteroides salyersiae TaxID=291644 RepID=UPI001C8C9C28|nr:glycoside hydrolase family 127 protein [Bacteroides salyersiae]
MKKIFLAIWAIGSLCACETIEEKVDYTYKEVPFTDVHFTDNFWLPRIETIRNVTVPFAFRKCEETHRIDNFAVAAGIKEGKFNSPYPFDDSDVYKIMEGASYLLAVKEDNGLDAYMDSLISLIGAAQEPDGYLYTTRTIGGSSIHPWAGKKRWENERDNSHELYNVGHMYEAAVAHYQATGKRDFLDIAIKSADLLCNTFGPEEGKLTVAPGHQEVEIGLVKLYRATGDRRYLDLSKFFLDARGKYDKYDRNSKDQFRSGAYWQDHKAVIDQDEAVGHAVRAAYMYSAMTDVAALRNEQTYRVAVDNLWDNVTGKKMYITGGIGSTRHGEAFGKNYELPNSTAYCETCASIANCMWNLRMFMLHGDAKYIDVLERSLYNAVLSGISLDGKEFFYPNVLSCDENGAERSEWFNCSCCPSNLSRFIPSIPGYVYATSDAGVYVNLYGANQAGITLGNGKRIDMSQKTSYPWEGNIELTVTPESKQEFSIMLRIPGWVDNRPVPSDLYTYMNADEKKIVIKINGEVQNAPIEKGYAVLARKWEPGDVIQLTLPMEVHKNKANDKVEADINHLSVERGPIVYCAEFADNNGAVLNYVLKSGDEFAVSPAPALFDGVNLLKGHVDRVVADKNYEVIKSVKDSLTLIPYYARSHRGNGEMTVWFPSDDNILKKQLVERGRITDKVIIGKKSSEDEHQMKGVSTNTGGPNTWRDASNDGWFSYTVAVNPDKQMELVLTYSSTDGGNREFEILVDNKKIAEQKLRAETFSAWIDKVYPIPFELTKGKKTVTVKVQALPGKIAGGVFGLRTQKQKD